MPNVFEYEPLNISGCIDTKLSDNLKTIEIIQYSMKNLRQPNLRLNIIDK